MTDERGRIFKGAEGAVIVVKNSMGFVRDILDAINTDGGHIVLAILLLFVGLFCLVHWQLPEGKELFVFAMGILGMALKSTGKANGKSEEKQP